MLGVRDTGVDVVVDARNDEVRRRLLLDAAIDGNLDLLASTSRNAFNEACIIVVD